MSRRPRRWEWLAYVVSLAPGLGLAAAEGAGLVSERVALGLFSVSFIGLNLAHLGATLSRVYLERGGGARRPVERLALPAAIVALALAGDALGAAAALMSAQYFLSLHHGSMESHGIIRYLQRRSGRRLAPSSTWLDRGACVLLPLGALAWRAGLPAGRTHGLRVLAPPGWVADALVAAGIAALLGWAAREVRARARGERVDPLGVALVLTTSIGWTAILWGLDHPMLPLFALASHHYAQHLFFVWRFEHRDGAMVVLPGALRARVAPPRRTGWLAATALLAGGVALALTGVTVALRAGASWAGLRPAGPDVLPPWTAAMIGVNLWHYWLDHRVWRLGSREVARPLALAPADPAPATPPAPCYRSPRGTG